jgi:ferric-dicitrate binding protein FerR (iron transport regulator)
MRTTAAADATGHDRRRAGALATALAAAVLALGAGAAHANDRVGAIRSADADGRTFTLDDGNVYRLQANAPRSAMEIVKQMKAGQRVRVTYEANASALYVSDVQPAD